MYFIIFIAKKCNMPRISGNKIGTKEPVNVTTSHYIKKKINETFKINEYSKNNSSWYKISNDCLTNEDNWNTTGPNPAKGEKSAKLKCQTFTASRSPYWVTWIEAVWLGMPEDIEMSTVSKGRKTIISQYCASSSVPCVFNSKQLLFLNALSKQTI